MRSIRIIIARWSWGLIREKLELDGDRVADLHLWRVGPGHSALIAAIVAEHLQSPGVYKERLASLRGLSHITIEVHPCAQRSARPA